jgi:hypothetical protein
MYVCTLQFLVMSILRRKVYLILSWHLLKAIFISHTNILNSCLTQARTAAPRQQKRVETKRSQFKSQWVQSYFKYFFNLDLKLFQDYWICSKHGNNSHGNLLKGQPVWPLIWNITLRCICKDAFQFHCLVAIPSTLYAIFLYTSFCVSYLYYLCRSMFETKLLAHVIGNCISAWQRY